MDLVLRKRKGFVRIALEAGADLVPVLTFGENEVYDVNTCPGPRLRMLQRGLKRAFGFTLPLFHGDGVLWGGGLLPRRVPLNIVVGAPLRVDKALDPRSVPAAEFAAAVDELHGRYCAHLKALYDAHKEAYAPRRRRSLELVE